MDSLKFYLKDYNKNPLIINDVIDINADNDFIRVKTGFGTIYRILLSEIIYFVMGE